MSAQIDQVLAQAANDPDVMETQEWLDALEAVLDNEGPERAHSLLERLIEKARRSGAYLPFRPNTAYVNTIATAQEREYPGDRALERRIEAYIRWNAAVMVVRANTAAEGIGGHLSTFASSASLYEVGFNHFFRGKDNGQAGDHVYFQGHAAPGVYARAYLERRFEAVADIRGGDFARSYSNKLMRLRVLLQAVVQV